MSPSPPLPDHLLHTLENTGMPPPLVHAILAVLEERSGSLSGRRSIVRELLSRRCSVTEGGMKRYLRVLRDADVVRVGRTKQGVALTDKGRHLLARLKAPPGGTFP